MKHSTSLATLSIVFAIFLCLIFPATPSLAQTPAPTPDAAQQSAARDFINLLVQGQFEQAAQEFDPKLLAAFPADKVAEAWAGLITQAGAFKDIGETIPVQEGGYGVVYVTTNFDKGSVDIKLVYNADGQIAGFFFNPAGSGKAAAQPYQTAPYVETSSFTEQDVTVGAGGEFPLPGTLTMPVGTGPFPAVVLVHGSGPNDRDETIFTNKPLRDLAEGLASQGIAVLRYDKRTKVYGQQMNENPLLYSAKEEVTDDALSALALLQTIPGVDAQRVFLLGHSLGGLMVPRIAAQAQDPSSGINLAGAIILAGPTQTLEDTVVRQVTYLSNLDGTITPDEQEKIDQIKQQAAKVKDANLTTDTPPDQLLGFPAAFWLDLRNYDPAQTAASLNIPLFILRGERDYQVDQADFDGWKAALGDKANVFLKQYPGLNHLFIFGTGPANPQEYQRSGHVSEQVVNDIASFINTGTVNTQAPFLGISLTNQDIIRLALLLIPILLIQLALSIYALVDLARRKHTTGPRWLWAVLLVITLFALPTGLIVAAIYLIWGRKEDEYEESEAGDDDQD